MKALCWEGVGKLGVRELAVGGRVVVGSVLACGGCWYCRTGQYSLCDNSNPQPNPVAGPR